MLLLPRYNVRHRLTTRDRMHRWALQCPHIEEVLATGLLEDNPLAECNQKHNNDSSYGTHGIMVTLRIERILDCKKLSVDASKNAAQSQLLPLRVMVQILFDGASTSCDIYNNKHYYYKRNSSFEKKLYKKKKM
ncbi:hypothetical protein F2Q68_00020974 [Brassica cretica]|uniref:Uncharacterized protein n=1 Tax=Brassica cretica TaxID=69181 RepID=A0A8S9FV79_BRACR|nr:hypothetical protein F2Q68_00020974 [Brassica cretica]